MLSRSSSACERSASTRPSIPAHSASRCRSQPAIRAMLMRKALVLGPGAYPTLAIGGYRKPAVRALSIISRALKVGSIAAAQHFFENRGVDRPAEIEPLVLIAAQFLQERHLVRAFHPYGPHFQPQAVRQRDDCPHDGRIVG